MMKRWLKLEAFPLLAILAWIGWLLWHADLPVWMRIAALLTFCMLPAGAGAFYGHAVGRAMAARTGPCRRIDVCGGEVVDTSKGGA